jgi:hypothetical protein
MSNKEFEIQLDRLSHSRKYADLYLNTDELSPEEVLAQVRDFLETRGV